VFAAGEVTGIGGMDLAAAEGAIAGHCAAGGRADDAALRPVLRRRTGLGRFADRLEAAHGIRPGWTAWLDDATLVCRCEEVPYGQLRRTASATGSRGLRSLKLSTRAGLGICQGRICGRTVEDLLARNAPGNALLDSTTTDRRPLAVPIRLGELAGGAPMPSDGPSSPGRGTP
jgi:NAD(P)H-nitrite reductase large subunit